MRRDAFHSPALYQEAILADFPRLFPADYAPAGRALSSLIPKYGKLDLLANPEKITEDPVLAFATAIYFWMTPRDNKPSCHAGALTFIGRLSS